jgi:hypothetical protein
MRRAALTRFDLVVLLALGVAIAGVLAVVLVRQRENGLRLQCTNNLRRLGDATLAYADAAAPGAPGPFLPPARIADGYATWAVLIAPHLVKDHPLQHWDVSKTYFAQPAEVREALLLPCFCPARVRPGGWLSVAGDTDPATKDHVRGALGDYAGVAGDGDPAHPWDGPDANGAIILGEVLERQGDRIVRWRGRTTLAAIQQARGLSTTLLLGEKHVPDGGAGRAEFGDGSLYNGQNAAGCARIAGPGFGLAPSPAAPFNTNFGSAHPGICQFLMADGGVRPFAVDMTDTVLGQLARRGK